MKKYECARCDHEITTSDTMLIESIGPCSCCGKDNWREVKEKPVLENSDPIVWHGPNEKFLAPADWDGSPVDMNGIPLADVMDKTDLKSFRVRITKSGYDSSWYSGLVGRVFDVVPYSESCYRATNNTLTHDPLIFHRDCERVPDDVIDTCPGCRDNQETSSESYRIWHTPCGQILMPDSWKGRAVQGIKFYPPDECPGCKEKDGEIARYEAEIARLENNVAVLKAESADWEKTACEISDRSSRQFGEIEDLKAENSTLKERITSLKCSLSDVATELDRRIKGLESDLGIERKKASDLQLDKAASEKSLASEILGLRDVVAARDGTIEIVSKRATDRKAQIAKLASDLKDMHELVDRYRDMGQDTAKRLEAERQKKVTLSITMDSEKIDSFLKAFPGFKPEESK